MNEKDGFKLKVTSSTKRSEEPVYIDDKVIPKMNFGGDTGIDADYEQAAADADANYTRYYDKELGIWFCKFCEQQIVGD